MIWREKRVWLIVAGILLAANLGYFFTYRVRFETRLKDAEASLHQAEDNLAKAKAARVAAEQQLAAYHKVTSELQVLYNQKWATEIERFTPLVLEVKRLTAACQMVPRTLQFSKVEVPRQNKAGAIGTSTVAIAFSVQGDYQQVRRLINLLELSDQFLIIDSIALGGNATDPKLTLNIRLKTLFREPATTGPGVAAQQFANKDM